VVCPAVLAVPKPKYWRIEEPGDLVEIDTKEIPMCGGGILKHFSAHDIVSRSDALEVHRRATSLAAARFLHTLQDRSGSRSKPCKCMAEVSSPAEFELACPQKELPLFVLPPKSPRLNALRRAL
jgi:putative transposase